MSDNFFPETFFSSKIKALLGRWCHCFLLWLEAFYWGMNSTEGRGGRSWSWCYKLIVLIDYSINAHENNHITRFGPFSSATDYAPITSYKKTSHTPINCLHLTYFFALKEKKVETCIITSVSNIQLTFCKLFLYFIWFH